MYACSRCKPRLRRGVRAPSDFAHILTRSPLAGQGCPIYSNFKSQLTIALF